MLALDGVSATPIAFLGDPVLAARVAELLDREGMHDAPPVVLTERESPSFVAALLEAEDALTYAVEHCSLDYGRGVEGRARLDRAAAKVRAALESTG